MVLALGLAFVPASVKDCSDRLLAGGRFVATSSRSRVVWGFRQQSLWIKDSQVILERNALMTSASTTSGRELYRWENLSM